MLITEKRVEGSCVDKRWISKALRQHSLSVLLLLHMLNLYPNKSGEKQILMVLI